MDITNNTHHYHQRKSGCGNLECVQGADKQMGGHCWEGWGPWFVDLHQHMRIWEYNDKQMGSTYKIHLIYVLCPWKPWQEGQGSWRWLSLPHPYQPSSNVIIVVIGDHCDHHNCDNDDHCADWRWSLWKWWSLWLKVMSLCVAREMVVPMAMEAKAAREVSLYI